MPTLSLPSTTIKRYRAFTLMELMIVVAIIGTLSAIAMPAYQDYVRKSEVTSAVTTMKALITPAELYSQQHGSLNSDVSLSDLGTSANASPLGTISVEDSQLVMTLSHWDDSTITLARNDAGLWSCAASGEAANLVSGCE